MPAVVIAPHADTLEWIRSLGWKGNRPCFGVRRDALKPALRFPAERKWLERPPVKGLLQAFLFVHLGTLLLTKVPGQTPWCVEPGTLDEQLLD